MAKTTKKEADSKAKPAKATTKSKTATKRTSPTRKAKGSAAKATQASKAKPTASKPSKTSAAANDTPRAVRTEAEGGAAKGHGRSRRAPVRTESVTTVAAGRGLAPTPTTQQIAERAYYLFLERGAGHGQDVDDWLEAERELTGTDA